jgi:hypothetical protein
MITKEIIELFCDESVFNKDDFNFDFIGFPRYSRHEIPTYFCEQINLDENIPHLTPTKKMYGLDYESINFYDFQLLKITPGVKSLVRIVYE